MDSSERHKLFVMKVAGSKIIWGLKSSDGWATTPSKEHEDRQVMPFWSERDDVSTIAAQKWPSAQPTSIPLNVFMELWLKSMPEDEILVGTNWSMDLEGKEIEPAELEKEILEYTEKNLHEP